MWRLNRYQWTVLFAAWLGWGFDIFDGLLFNYVAPNCVPTLLHLTIGTPEAKSATLYWTGLLTSVLLIGWAVGGVIFGQLADRIGRSKTLLLTMLLYALGTASCAFAPNIWVLILFRLVASLGIGGEWAAGASMVAEVMPEKARVEAGALLYTSASAGLFLATYVNYQIAGVVFAGSPETSWRYVFLCGLIPAAAAFLMRLFVKEPERWQNVAATAAPPKLSELFNRKNFPLTRSGFLMALTALLTWWSCNAFIPVVATGLARTAATAQGLNEAGILSLIEQWKVVASNSFNLGGLIGTLLTIPAAKYLGRKKMFTIYFLLSGASILATFGLPLAPETRLYMYFGIGLSVFGVFGSFTYYLPELFPTRLRATGAGFCYNIGRIIAAAGPFIVGRIASQGTNSAIQTLFWVGFVPLIGLAFIPWVIETKGQALAD
ncbi:MAG: MFS transporter [Nostocaceae cyanobacterium]|nr:MFS transporter [Nostocaceae cyanobacterium]